MKFEFNDNSSNKKMEIELADEEVKYLLEYALVDLLRRGLLSVDDTAPDDSTQLDFLRNTPTSEMSGA